MLADLSNTMNQCKKWKIGIFFIVWKNWKSPALDPNLLPKILESHTPCQKHLGLYLNKKINFNHHINVKISKANNGIGIIKRLSHILPKKSLITIYKFFIRSHLGYCDVIYDQPNNESFSTKIEQIQYNAALVIISTIRGTSQTKLYHELGLESLNFRRCFRRPCSFFKIKIHGRPEYLTRSHQVRFITIVRILIKLILIIE